MSAKNQRPTIPAAPAAEVPKHRQCPCCFGGMGGVGRAYSSRGTTTYYKCQSCGHTWTVNVKMNATVLEHRVREIETR